MSPSSESPRTPRTPLLILLLDQWGDLWMRTFDLIGGVYYLITDVLG